MLATILLVGTCLYLIGLRADQVNSARKEKSGFAFQQPATQEIGLVERSKAEERVGLYRGKPSAYWAFMYRERTRQLQQARRALRRRWQPTVDYALRLASSVFGVSYWQLRSVAWCESTHNPWATNGRYKGLFQLSWSPYGFSPYDPVASSLSTAATVSREGWRQWACKP